MALPLLFPYCSLRDLSFGLALLAAGGFSWSCVPGLFSVLRSSPSLSQFRVLLFQVILFFREYSPANSTLPGLSSHTISMSVRPAQQQVENTGSVLTLTVLSAWAVGCDEGTLGNQCLRTPCVSRMPVLCSSQGTLCQLCFRNHTLNLPWVWRSQFPLGPPVSWSCLE